MVIKAIGFNTYPLEVSESMRWYKVVHLTLLKQFRGQEEPQDRNKDKKEIWKVKEIVNSRRVKAVVQYRVR